MFYKSTGLYYTICVVDKRKLVLLKSEAVPKDGILALETTKLEETALSEEVFEMIGYTIGDTQDFIMMITKIGSTQSLARYKVDYGSESKKMTEEQNIILGVEPVGSLVADREFTAISFPNGKSL
jgi:hypothetical protein